MVAEAPAQRRGGAWWTSVRAPRDPEHRTSPGLGRAATVQPMRPTDYEEDPPTHVETPLPIRHDPDALTYRFPDDETEPAEREGAQRT